MKKALLAIGTTIIVYAAPAAAWAHHHGTGINRVNHTVEHAAAGVLLALLGAGGYLLVSRRRNNRSHLS